ncbi:MAG: hypothetical protein LBU51_07395, partial [Bacteroidales bacterium]|nr:hypothetical protein [Bacteroidales bacterium]
MKKIFFLTILMLFSVSIFSQKKKIKKEKINTALNFSKPIHCLGIYLNNGFSYSSQSKGLLQGTIIPKIYHSYMPEINLLYSCILKDGFGFTLEIPIGVFKKTSIFPVSNFTDFDDVRIEIGSHYIGFAAKFAYFKQLHKNIFMQADFGVKFLPFYYSADHWDTENHIINPNYSMVFAKVVQKNYAVPDFNSS